MIELVSRVEVGGVTAGDLARFLLNPSDEAYQRWWPGVHLAFHVVRQRPGHLGETVAMDERIGRRRLRMKAVVEEVVPGRRITWRGMMGVRLPVRIVLDLEQTPVGVRIIHAIRAGGRGAWRLLDPLFRLYLSAGFARDMDAHAREEFPRLARMLRAGAPLTPRTSP
jgi:hypothetical protein